MASQEDKKWPDLFCIGNPLLDMQVTNGEPLLERYNLKPNDAILAAPEQMGLYDDIVKSDNVKYVAGGAAQNAARGAAVSLEIAMADSNPSDDHRSIYSPQALSSTQGVLQTMIWLKNCARPTRKKGCRAHIWSLLEPKVALAA